MLLMTIFNMCCTFYLQMMYILARVPPVAYVKAIDVWMNFCLLFVSLVLVEYAIVKVRGSINLIPHMINDSL